MAELNQSSSEHGGRSRGNVLAMLGGAVAGALAGALAQPGRALGGHDGTDVMHIGVVNQTPDGLWTGLNANFDNGEALGLQNFGSGGGMFVQSRGGAAISGNAIGTDLSGVDGYSSADESGLGDGTGFGVQGFSGSGVGVHGRVVAVPVSKALQTAVPALADSAAVELVFLGLRKPVPAYPAPHSTRASGLQASRRAHSAWLATARAG